jgi:hypothetical protein
MREWRYNSTIRNFGTRWRWVVSFTPLLLYLQGNGHLFPLYRRLGGPQSQESNPDFSVVQPIILATILTELSRLPEASGASYNPRIVFSFKT